MIRVLRVYCEYANIFDIFFILLYFAVNRLLVIKSSPVYVVEENRREAFEMLFKMCYIYKDIDHLNGFFLLFASCLHEAILTSAIYNHKFDFRPKLHETKCNFHFITFISKFKGSNISLFTKNTPVLAQFL